MVRKRPHKLRYESVISTDGYFDNYGDWIQGEEVKEVVTLSCRADVNLSGRTVPNNQGHDFVYSYEIFLDKIPDSLARNMKIDILKGNKLILTGEVIMPFEYQEHCRVWV